MSENPKSVQLTVLTLDGIGRNWVALSIPGSSRNKARTLTFEKTLTIESGEI